MTAMIGAGVRLIVARSFSRIYFRNAVNNGPAVVVCPEIAEAVRSGDAVEADLRSGRASVAGRPFDFTPLPEEVLAILTAGGLWAARQGPAAREVS